MVAVAVKVTLVPTHIEPAGDAAILTLTGSDWLMATVAEPFMTV